MHRVIEIDSFIEKFQGFMRSDEWRVRYPIHICRIFEVLELKVFTEIVGAQEAEFLCPTSMDILPRLEMSSLKFKINVNVKRNHEEDQALEEVLSKYATDFFTHECAPSIAAFNGFIEALDPDKAKVLFLIEPGTLLIHISG